MIAEIGDALMRSVDDRRDPRCLVSPVAVIAARRFSTAKLVKRESICFFAAFRS